MSIKLYIGPMCAGKSSSMLRDIERYRLAGKKCIIIKHSGDTRYDNMALKGGIVCHNMVEYSAVQIATSEVLSGVNIDLYDVVGVSEIQFYSDALTADKWANNGKIVICEGLNSDFRREIFPQVQALIPKCEKVRLLNAICIGCGSTAHFTKKLSGDMEKIIDVGAHDKYMPVCRKCY